jgi:hypothetical protein
VVHEGDIQDRDGAPLVLAATRYLYPWLRHVFADGAYSGTKLDTALDKIGQWTIEIVKRSDAVYGFVADSDEAGRGFRFENGHHSDLKAAGWRHPAGRWSDVTSGLSGQAGVQRTQPLPGCHHG